MTKPNMMAAIIAATYTEASGPEAEMSVVPSSMRRKVFFGFVTRLPTSPSNRSVNAGSAMALYSAPTKQTSSSSGTSTCTSSGSARAARSGARSALSPEGMRRPPRWRPLRPPQKYSAERIGGEKLNWQTRYVGGASFSADGSYLRARGAALALVRHGGVEFGEAQRRGGGGGLGVGRQGGGG